MAISRQVSPTLLVDASAGNCQNTGEWIRNDQNLDGGEQ
jgi:hypothetical protein